MSGDLAVALLNWVRGRGGGVLGDQQIIANLRDCCPLSKSAQSHDF